MSVRLVKGNEAVIQGALMGGATHFFGYPITPASEIAHAAALYFPQAGRTFLQAESEVASINMIYGAASAGARAMTASSGPGISLMAEGLSYLAGAELPSVVVDVQRAGPGLGNIWPEQSDYTAVVKGGGHGNYRNVVLAPASGQEMCDFAYRAFDIADTWRITVLILADAYVGQMMEPVRVPEVPREGARKPWAVYGDRESRTNLVTSIMMKTELLAEHNRKLQEKYRRMAQSLTAFVETDVRDAQVVLVAYGITARVCLSAVKRLRARGIRAGLLRPTSLFPFPTARIREIAGGGCAKVVIAAELAAGQMAEDVELAVAGRLPVLRYEWLGGMVPSEREIEERVLAESLATVGA
jgi:pyruvate/2-oxoacid:ferredoxin oxidoreductase alpha subunit